MMVNQAFLSNSRKAMEISNQVTSLSALNLTQNLGGNDIAATRPIPALDVNNTTTSNQNSDSSNTQSTLRQADRQAAIDRPASNTAAYTNFVYENSREVMKVLGTSDVLLYQIPARGELEIIKAENAARAIDATA